MGNGTKLLQVFIDPEQHRVLKLMAADKGTTVSEFIRKAVAKIVTGKAGRRVARESDARNG